jgi:hypothetical protein
MFVLKTIILLGFSIWFANLKRDFLKFVIGPNFPLDKKIFKANFSNCFLFFDFVLQRFVFGSRDNFTYQ